MNWIGRLFHKRRMEEELRKELQFHIERQVADYVREGLTENEARRRAHLEFGGAEQIGEECRDARGTAWLESILQDLRLSARILRKSPGFTVAAVGTLALGIGANTAIFQLLDTISLRTLPVKDPHRLAVVDLADRKGWRGSQATDNPALTNPQWEWFRDHQDTFSGTLAWGDNNFNLAPGGEVRLANGLFVSGNFFQVLGIQPLLGRVFSPGEDRRGCGLPGAVVSYAFWQRELGGDAAAVGRPITLNYQRVDVIGVTPPEFSGLEIGRGYDVAVPICSQAALWNMGNWLDAGTVWWLTVMGRLKPEQSVTEADAHLRATTPALFRATLPANYPAVNVKDYLNFKLKAETAGTGVSSLRSQYGEPLLLLLATAGLVLLIACANLANLVLARSTARQHEFAVRLAIGASRRRLIQQLMLEGVLLAAAGATVAIGLSGAITQFLVALLGSDENPLFLDLRPDWSMFAFTAAAAGLTCIIFGLTPAYQATRTAAVEAMKVSGRTLGTSRRRFGLRQILVVSQVSLSLVLLVTALLFSGSLRNLLAVDAGFQQHGILVATIDFSRVKIPAARPADFERDLLHRIRAIPGVSSAAASALIPLAGGGTSNLVWKEGNDPNRKLEAFFHWFGDGYLKTMGMPLLAGRDFNEHDTAASPPVAIVNQTFARRLGLGDNPIGRSFRREATPSQPELVFEVVGLVRDTKYFSLRDESLPIAFLPIAQDPQPSPYLSVFVRSSTSLSATTSAIREVILQVNPAINLGFRPFDNIVQQGLSRERLMATLSGAFGGLASLIAALGLYGVMSYMVVHRTNEIGVRVALGAGRREILALIMGQSGMLLLIGLSAGTLLALAFAGTARSMLFGLKPYDAPTLGLAVAMLSAVTLAASYLPARRAARLDPMIALREE